MEKNNKIINIPKEEKEQAAISIIKTLSKKDIPIEDIEYLTGKTKKEIELIINNLKNNHN